MSNQGSNNEDRKLQLGIQIVTIQYSILLSIFYIHTFLIVCFDITSKIY